MPPLMRRRPRTASRSPRRSRRANYLNQPVTVMEQALTGTYADGLGGIKYGRQTRRFRSIPMAVLRGLDAHPDEALGPDQGRCRLQNGGRAGVPGDRHRQADEGDGPAAAGRPTNPSASWARHSTPPSRRNMSRASRSAAPDLLSECGERWKHLVELRLVRTSIIYGAVLCPVPALEAIRHRLAGKANGPAAVQSRADSDRFLKQSSLSPRLRNTVRRLKST